MAAPQHQNLAPRSLLPAPRPPLHRSSRLLPAQLRMQRCVRLQLGPGPRASTLHAPRRRRCAAPLAATASAAAPRAPGALRVDIQSVLDPACPWRVLRAPARSLLR
jgi:hypothetical protein